MTAPFSWREELRRRPGVVPAFTLPAERTALVLVDMQNASTSRGYGADGLFANDATPSHEYYFGRMETVVLPNCLRLLDAFRTADWAILHVTLGSLLPDGRDFEPLRMAYDRVLLAQGRISRPIIPMAGTPDHSIVTPLAPQPGEIVLNKASRSAFSSTGIDQILRNLGVEGLVVAGTTTNACVGTTASDAADRGYRVVIVEDAAAAPSALLHECALLNFAYLFGRVLTTADVLAELGLA